MGVLPCDRQDCENIMCDRYSYEFGYLCWECFEELVALGTQDWLNVDIVGFLASPKPHRSGSQLAASQAYFEEIFPLRDSIRQYYENLND